MDSSYNPFNPNSVVAPNLFAGRVTQVVGICKKLAQVKHKMPASFFLYGERGIGKTALVKLVKFIAEDKDPELHSLNFLTSYYLVEQGQHIDNVLEESVNKLTQGLDKSTLSKIAEKAGSVFNNGKFSFEGYGISVGVEGSKHTKKEASTIKDRTVSALSSILKTIDEDGESKRDGALIILDEIHNIKDIRSIGSILRNIITTLDVDNLASISFILVGYQEDHRAFFEGDASAHRNFDSVPLSTMPDNEATEVLTKGFDKVGLEYDKEFIEEHISSTGGYPHSIQILGHNLVEVNEDQKIDAEDWHNAIVKTSIELKSKDFSRMFNFEKSLKEADKILVYLATENTSKSKNDLKAKFGANVYTYITRLKKLGAIKEDDLGNITLHSQLFRTAIIFDKLLRNYEKKK